MNRNSHLETLGARSPAFADLAEVNRHIEQARVLRAQATAALLGAAFHALARPVRALAAGAARWHQERTTEAALTRCSDRVLADIGFAREDIPLIARGLDPKQQPERSATGVRRWPALLAPVQVLGMIRRGAGDDWPGRHPQTLADRA